VAGLSLTGLLLLRRLLEGLVIDQAASRTTLEKLATGTGSTVVIR